MRRLFEALAKDIQNPRVVRRANKFANALIHEAAKIAIDTDPKKQKLQTAPVKFVHSMNTALLPSNKVHKVTETVNFFGRPVRTVKQVELHPLELADTALEIATRMGGFKAIKTMIRKDGIHPSRIRQALLDDATARIAIGNGLIGVSEPDKNALYDLSVDNILDKKRIRGSY